VKRLRLFETARFRKLLRRFRESLHNDGNK
jgi:hypothetical protein